MSLEIKALLNEINNEQINKCPEIIVKNQFVKTNLNSAMEKMRSEDLAALDKIDEETVIKELEERFKCNEFHTFIGDVLLILNPNEKTNIYDQKVTNILNLKSYPYAVLYSLINGCQLSIYAF